MIAAIIDIVSSRNLSRKKREDLDKNLRGLLNEVFNRFGEYIVAHPSLTQGDSIEMLVTSWQPIVFLFHKLLVEEIEFRVGLGTGTLTLQKKNTDECDGPVFWNARGALEEIKEKKYMTRRAGFNIDEESSMSEANAVAYSILFLTSFLGQTSTQLQHCYYYLWERMNISEIAAEVKTTKANVSKSLSKTPCYLLERVFGYLDGRPMKDLKE